MLSTEENQGDLPSRPQKGLWGWLNRRTGMDALLRTALYEPIPGGARFAYIFGSGLLFIFISQVITGVFLALYYVPSADHAHTTVAYITKAITAGSFLRSLHAYGSSAMVVVLLLHL
jgi:ubiquinol-cytochrome c reductase cytochrome b subunit